MTIALVTGLMAACSPQAPAQNVPAEESPQTGLMKAWLTIHSGNGDHRFRIDVAESSEQQERGLMFVRSLDPDRGMIFPYNPPQNVGFWMRNTLIPLDMLFISADRRVGRIVTARPLDETNVPSGAPVSAVLEIAGGRAAQLGIRVGDTVEWAPDPL